MYLVLYRSVGPNAVQFGKNLAFAVEGSTAGTVPQALGAVHGADELGMGEDALPAGLATKHLFLNPFLRLEDDTH